MGGKRLLGQSIQSTHSFPFAPNEGEHADEARRRAGERGSIPRVRQLWEKRNARA